MLVAIEGAEAWNALKYVWFRFRPFARCSEMQIFDESSYVRALTAAARRCGEGMLGVAADFSNVMPLAVELLYDPNWMDPLLYSDKKGKTKAFPSVSWLQNRMADVYLNNMYNIHTYISARTTFFR